MKKLIILFALIIINADIYSQTEVEVVTLQKPPLYKFNIPQMWNISLNNTTDKEFRVYLKGTAVKNGEGLVAEAITDPLDLGPGFKVVNAMDLQPINVKKFGNYGDIIDRTGNLPPGDYEICVEVISVNNNLTIGSECYDHSIQNLSQVQLISPMNGTDIQDLYPVFSWLPPTPVSDANLNYTLSIYEILSRQTPYNAVQSNLAFFQMENIRQTVVRYPAASRNFENGKSYAVIVAAFIGTQFISESEVGDFTYTDTLFNIANSSRNKFALLDIQNHLSLSAASKLLKERKRLIEFGGSAKIKFEASDNPGAYSKMKNVFGRISVTPQIILSGIPFGVNLFYATDQSGSKQNMNNFSVDFSADSLKALVLKKVGYQEREVREEGDKRIRQGGEQFSGDRKSKSEDEVIKNLSYPMKLFSQLENFGVGKNYPKYSEYTLSGVAVTGLNFEFNPGLFYIALTGPLNNKAIENVSYQRNLYSGRLGIGKKGDSHLFFTALYAKDDASSIAAPQNPYLTPKENYVIGTEGNLMLLQNKLKIEGEIGISMLTDDTQAPALTEENIPEWVKNFFNPTMSSRVDGYYKIGTTYRDFNSGTTIKANVLMVGPGYMSLGSPDKANDKIEFELMAEQKFFNEQLRAKVSAKTGRDNLLEGYKSYTTKKSFLNVNLAMKFKNFPEVNVHYYPVFQKNDAVKESAILDNINHNLNIFAIDTIRIAGLNNAASLSFAWNAANTYRAKNNSYSWNAYLTNAVYFNSSLFVSGSIGLLKSGIIFTPNTMASYDTYTFDIAGGYTFFEVWQSSAGFNMTTSPGQNRNLMFFINSTARIMNLFNFDMRLEKRIYNDMNAQGFNYDNIIFRSTLSMDLN